MKISEVSKRSGCSIQAIRYYEKEGLISAPSRTEGNFRLYGSEEIERLSFIKHCRTLDLSLSEIKHLLELQYLPSTPCETVNVMIDEHLKLVETRIADLQKLQSDLKKLQSDLKKLRGQCSSARSIDQCGILEALSPKSNYSVRDA
jgi:Cd(II)/Pb(II)-responsive transcriptional regulator